MAFYAHTDKSQSEPGDRWQALDEHLRQVAQLARERAATAAGSNGQMAIIAWWAGLLHDVGKYRPEFQQLLRRLRARGKETHHKQGGAAWAWDAKHWDIAFAIAGHHGGLPDAAGLKSLVVEPGGRDVAAAVRNKALCELPELAAEIPPPIPPTDALAFDIQVRMLFSCLVDADWSDTGEHERRANGLPALPNPAPLSREFATMLLRRVLDYINSRAEACLDAEENVRDPASAISPERHVPTIRAEILQAARDKTVELPGLFSMTVPTGGGKTLTSLAFALEHAQLHGLRRVIYVAPYLSILEQNAREIRRALRAELNSPDADLVFEHHSLAEPPGGDEDEAESEARTRQSQAWNAPFVLTTNVQFFESLFSNQPSQCRKLHNIARSVVILDECQTLPPGLIEPTCSMLQGLCRSAGTTIVLCTATQPAWSKRPDWAKGLENVREIVNPELNLFERLRRVNVTWPQRDQPPFDWPDVAKRMVAEQAALCIVNTKKAAKFLFDEVRERADPSAFHLSTAMCPAHRLEVLDEVRRRLKGGERCHLVSTQLIEAGVDVDFPLVMREFAPLEAIVQSAGRCNREGRMNNPDGTAGGRAIVFRSIEGNLPRGDGWYPKGRDVVESAFLNANREPDVGLPQHMREYFVRLYAAGTLDVRRIEDLRKQQCFETVWRGDENDKRRGRYRIVEDDTFPVVVGTWLPRMTEIQKLLDELGCSPSTRLFRELGRYQLNLRHYEKDALGKFLSLESANVQVWRGKYDDRIGLVPEMDDLEFVI